MGDIAEAFRRSQAEPGEASPADSARGLQPETGPADLPREEERRAEPTSIPDTRDADWQSRAVWVEKHGPVAETFRQLALRVRNELAARGASSVLVVSCDRDEGKSVTACNLALALASISAGERIALVEIDLRRPSLARYLAIRPEVGFEEVLAGEASLQDCWIPTEIPALDLFPVRQRVTNAHERLARPSLARALHQLERSYSVVVCDGPPVLPVPDVGLIAPHVGAYLPVVRAGETSRSGFTELVEMLPRTRLIGALLNCARPARYRRYYQDDEAGAQDGAS